MMAAGTRQAQIESLRRQVQDLEQDMRSRRHLSEDLRARLQECTEARERKRSELEAVYSSTSTAVVRTQEIAAESARQHTEEQNTQRDKSELKEAEEGAKARRADTEVIMQQLRQGYEGFLLK